jgi:hypothetical protein
VVAVADQVDKVLLQPFVAVVVAVAVVFGSVVTCPLLLLALPRQLQLVQAALVVRLLLQHQQTGIQEELEEDLPLAL